MVDTLRNSETAIALAKFLDEHNGMNTIVVDIGDKSSFSDYFIITTVTSHGHLRGLLRHVKKWIGEKDLEIFHRQKKVDDNGWVLLDCGYFVVHLMSREMREFYDLEKLWQDGKVIYISSNSS